MATRVENPLHLAGWEIAIAETSAGETAITLTPHVCRPEVPIKWPLELFLIDVETATVLANRLLEQVEAIRNMSATRQ